MSGQDSHSAYYAALTGLGKALDGALAELRAREDTGRVTAAEAARERCELLERHLAECRRLRRERGGQP